VDHSYAHLIHQLPSDRTGVLCHDLDTFRCVLNPDAERRPRWFRSMTRRILDGLSKAAVIFHTTECVRRQLLQYGIADEQRLVRAPLGVAPEFFHDGSATAPPAEPFLLHVGSCIRRKRIDILLDVFAGVKKQHPKLRLVQAGGRFTDERQRQIDRLGIAQSVQQRRDLSRFELASLYRQASLVLLTSEAEGFGLPAIEALACGAVVLASDIPAFREVAGDAVEYLPVDDVSAWIDAVHRLLTNPAHAPALAHRLQQAQRYSWPAHAQIIAQTYLRLASSLVPSPCTRGEG
jgi:glycosyltransferase involved in cell wall biosynthesis